MKAIAPAFLVAVSMLFAPAAMAKDKTWKCSAPGIKEGRYTGGDTAYIHLSAFPTGGDYRLTKKYKKSVTGFTANNTRFVCRLS
jgi:hypothetical protein